jgi:hypothetical protein
MHALEIHRVQVLCEPWKGKSFALTQGKLTIRPEKVHGTI